MVNIAVHGHFYQPPREDPWLGKISKDPSAAPYHDWNERVCAECYLPNSCARILGNDGRIVSTEDNYKYLSFNFGPTLHKWIEAHDPALDRIITQSADRAIAQAYNHIIMPLACTRDKATQIIWGVGDFEYRFGRKPKGMWLPETAVDIETLELLAANGIKFTILAQTQCAAVEDGGVWREIHDGAGLDVTLPYRCELPSGNMINIVFYHGGLARDIAFGKLLDNGDTFYDALMSCTSHDNDHLLVVATDGETYGHHHKFGEMALARLFERIKGGSEAMPNIGDFLEAHPPKNLCRIKENTSWSCVHGVERWRSDCGCHTGGRDGWNQEWRGPLRSAFDNLRDRIDEIYDEKVSVLADPWKLRDEAAELYFSASATSGMKHDFIHKRFGSVDRAKAAQTLALIEAERMRMFMYTSCGWFFNDISGIETMQVISYAIRAAELAGQAGNTDLIADLVNDLGRAKGNTIQVPTAGIAAEKIIGTHAQQEHVDAFSGTDALTLEEKTEYGDTMHIGGNDMTVMNYGNNLAASLLTTLEHDPAFRNIAYFSMEIALAPEIPTYSGGLGVLAGDILRSAADMGVPMVGMTLLYRKGYFAQKINKEGRQTELPVNWSPEKYLSQLPNRVVIKMNGRDVTVAAWCYMLVGQSGHPLPVFLLDTDLPENTPEDREFTSELYGGDNRYRLCQELILGIAGLRMLRDMGFRNVNTFHLNEGHAGFITLELLREQGYGDIAKVRNQVIFTTHTPVAAGHDFFSYDLISEVLENDITDTLRGAVGGSGLSMTDLALIFSRYVNGVSRRHAEVSRAMFGNDAIDWITNGVHSTTWTSPSFAKLYDENIPGWRNDPSRLMQAFQLRGNDIWKAHQAAKMKLLALVLEDTGQELDPDILTIGFARRAATYKRADLVFSDIKRLLEIGKGKIQFIFAGKAHPHDEPGKDILQKIYTIAGELHDQMPVVFIENYNMASAKLITSGVDLWLNTPVRPREASGTSGMKCVHNGAMNFSVLDGWWIEGCIEDVTGWAIGPEPGQDDMDGYDESLDANDLYKKLEEKIIPTYYNDKKLWIKMMRAAIAVNASYFNTHRVVKEYCEKAYGTVFRGH